MWPFRFKKIFPVSKSDRYTVSQWDSQSVTSDDWIWQTDKLHTTDDNIHLDWETDTNGCQVWNENWAPNMLGGD